METQTYRWQGLDDPSRCETAVVQLHGDSLDAHGASTSARYSTAWHLTVGAGWVTQELSVATFGDGWSRSLRLGRSSRGDWTAEAHSRGHLDDSTPGIADPSELTGAMDCDLGLCPLTNIMPIRRLRLLEHHVEPVPLVMAWVDVPSLRVIRSEQIYGSGTLDSASAPTVRYASRSRDFNAELTVDAAGIVVLYPTLAELVRGG